MSTQTATPTGADYPVLFDGRYDPAVGLRNGGVSDRLRDRLVREERQKLHRQTFTPVTVMNLQPFPVAVNLGELGRLEVEAAPDANGARTVIKHYRLSMRDLGDGNFTPVSVLPVELAKELVREYAETGGVFWFSGEGEPSAEAMAEARERQQAWYRKEYQAAVDSWSRYHQHKMLTDRQRDAARALFAAGDIAELPEWVTINRAQADRRMCPDCGEDCKMAARICWRCRYEFAPKPETVASASVLAPEESVAAAAESETAIRVDSE